VYVNDISGSFVFLFVLMFGIVFVFVSEGEEEEAEEGVGVRVGREGGRKTCVLISFTPHLSSCPSKSLFQIVRC